MLDPTLYQGAKLTILLKFAIAKQSYKYNYLPKKSGSVPLPEPKKVHFCSLGF
jgi:hypothetical protein